MLRLVPHWFTPRQVPLVKGLNAVYVAGRSNGYGLDRMAVFKSEKADVARDPSTKEAKTR